MCQLLYQQRRFEFYVTAIIWNKLLFLQLLCSIPSIQFSGLILLAISTGNCWPNLTLTDINLKHNNVYVNGFFHSYDLSFQIGFAGASFNKNHSVVIVIIKIDILDALAICNALSLYSKKRNFFFFKKWKIYVSVFEI